MRVLLIKPSLSQERLYGKIREMGNTQPPLGVAYVASSLEAAGHKVRIVDEAIEELDHDSSRDIDVIGISSNTVEFPTSVTMSRVFKYRRDIPIILGGPHISAIPEYFLHKDYDCFDVGVVGEGELTMPTLLENLHDKDMWRNIPGLVYRDNGEVRVNPPHPIGDLDALPFPARHLLPDISKYKPTAASARRLPLGSIITSRGCPFQCTFCDRSVFGNSVRARSPWNILDELTEMKEVLGIKEFRVFDDVFNFDQGRVRSFCEGLIERKLDMSWTCVGRLNYITPEQVKLLVESGCWQIAVGIESGNNGILRLAKKALTVDMVRETVEIAHKGGLNVRGFFMLGLPGDTKGTIMDTINLAKELPLDVASFTILTPYPNTEIFRNYNIRVDNWEKLIQTNPDDPDTILFCPEGLTKEDLKYYYHKAFRSFYLRPQYIWKKLKDVRNWYMLKSYFRGLKTLLRWDAEG